ncbi:hypothetical protein OSH11_21745 [Kaistia dalseonensis]|uniref:C1q domain-containing protein n=1 Tax=Kaistia dalseonensis TaxID=410840 RepID=A0ABU0HCD5_9HYPH|nr:hypothetical protein [Kaistia dalseonensis]MCX5497336.1 hypothetical protein [Kaistia dalseonensis]MDQ0439973.1 hypothetical protein [Kaistia dalseonensis]
MDRVNGRNWIDIGGGRRGFRGKNAVAGLAGTQVTAVFLTALQEEVLKVVEDAGLDPDEDDLTQLWQAINILIGIGVAGGSTSFATLAEVIAGIVTGKAVDPAKLAAAVQSGAWRFAVAGGTANALTATLAPVPTSLGNGMMIVLVIAATNTGAATLNANGLGARPIVGPDGAALRAGDLLADETAILVYRTSINSWVLLTPPKLSSQITGFKAWSLGAVTIPSATYTLIKMTTPVFDTNAGYSTGTGIYTVKRAGVYLISGNFWMPDTANISNIYIAKNGAYIAESSANSRGRVLSVSTLESCAVNDQLTFLATQYSGASLVTDAGGYAYTFSAALMGNV